MKPTACCVVSLVFAVDKHSCFLQPCFSLHQQAWQMTTTQDPGCKHSIHRHPFVCRTVTDMAVNPLGLIIAAVSVVTSGMQQILCGVVQRKHSLTSNQLLSNTAPVQVTTHCVKLQACAV